MGSSKRRLDEPITAPAFGLLLTSHCRNRNPYLLQRACDTTARNVVGGKAGNAVAFEGEHQMLLGEGDLFVGDGNRWHAWQHEVFGVGTGDLYSPCHNIVPLLSIMEVKLPIGEGSLEGTLYGEKFVFAH